MLDVPLLHYLSDALTVTNRNFAWVKSKWNTQGKDILLAGARQGTLLSLSFTPPFGLQHSFGFAFWGPLIWFRKDLVLLQLIVWSTLTLVELGARLGNLQEFLTADVLYVFFVLWFYFFFILQPHIQGCSGWDGDLLLIMEKQMPWLPKDNRKWRNMGLICLKLVAKLLFWAGLTTCIKLEGKIKSTLKWMWSNSSSRNLSFKKCITAKIVSAYLKYLQVKTEWNFWK